MWTIQFNVKKVDMNSMDVIPVSGQFTETNQLVKCVVVVAAAAVTCAL